MTTDNLMVLCNCVVCKNILRSQINQGGSCRGEDREHAIQLILAVVYIIIIRIPDIVTRRVLSGRILRTNNSMVILSVVYVKSILRSQ